MTVHHGVGVMLEGAHAAKSIQHRFSTTPRSSSMRYQRLVASIALKTFRHRGEAEDVIQPVLPAMFLLRHFGETPKCRAPRPFIEIETYAQ